VVRERPSLRGRSARVRQSSTVPDRADWVLPSELVGAHGSSPSGMRRDGGHALLVGDDRFGPGPILWRWRPPNLGPDDYFRGPWWSSCLTPAWPCPTISLVRLMAVTPNGWPHKSLSDDRMLPRGQRGTLPAPRPAGCCWAWPASFRPAAPPPALHDPVGLPQPEFIQVLHGRSFMARSRSRARPSARASLALRSESRLAPMCANMAQEI